MGPKLDEAAVIGRWLHAFEEDEPGRVVFRLDTWIFPSSRRPRFGFDLEPGGRAVEREPGPADQRTARTGSWRLDEDGHLWIDIEGRPRRRLDVESAGGGRLVVKA
jgi:hypothetical protein